MVLAPYLESTRRPPLGAQARALPCPLVVQIDEHDTGRRRPCRLAVAAGPRDSRAVLLLAPRDPPGRAQRGGHYPSPAQGMLVLSNVLIDLDEDVTLIDVIDVANVEEQLAINRWACVGVRREKIVDKTSRWLAA